MKAYNPKNIVFAVLSALMLISCSGSSGGGIGGSGIATRGSISSFGSVIIKGTEFDTSDAIIIVGGKEIGVGDDVVLANLDIGMVVTIEGTGTQDDAIADQVTYNNNVEGPIESIIDIDSTTKEIVVLGQIVIVNVITELRGVTFETIDLDDVVEVSGFFDDTGAIWATFLEKTGEFIPGLVVEVQGFVVNLDTVLETFEVNNLTVDYSLADLSALPGGELVDGLLVEVEGTLDATGGEMLAAVIEPGDELGTENADEIEITGFVTDLVSGFEFTVGNQPVEADGDTLFVDGTAGDVALGVKLEAEGSLMDGILYAEEVEFWGPDQIEVEGVVTDFVSVFEFTVGDQVVHTDADTVFEGLAPEDIELGMILEIKGVPVDIDHSILVADKVSLDVEEG